LSPDFVDDVVPELEAGDWTNLGHTPKIVSKRKGGPTSGTTRGNKNERVEVKNREGADEEPILTFDSTTILSKKSGSIVVVSTNNTDREAMKLDVQAIIKAAGIPFTMVLDNDPKIRNKESTSFLMTITDC
jgi:hypothetical protein